MSTSATGTSRPDSPPLMKRPRRGRRRRVAVVLGVAVALLGALFYGGGGWYFAGEIRDGITVREYSPADWDLRVSEVGPGSVTLEPADEEPALSTDKVYGMAWPGGYGQVGELHEQDGEAVVRSLTVLRGEAPEVGDDARLEKAAFDGPGTAFDAAVSEVTIRSDGRSLPAWYAPGRGSTWAILTHGKGVTRTEVLRLMRSTVSLGLPSLDISYRRDPETGGGLIRFGQDEWHDLEAAVRFAVTRGAREVVLLGCSAGGGISAAFMESSPLASRVRAMVLDAPMLDFGATVAHGAADRELPLVGLAVPDSLVWVARRIAGVRFDVDPGRTDYLDDTDWLRVPTLVFHGTSDDTVPYSVAERLLAADPELVQLELVPGAEHVESWNLMPERYDELVLDFLAPYAPVD